MRAFPRRIRTLSCNAEALAKAGCQKGFEDKVKRHTGRPSGLGQDARNAGVRATPWSSGSSTGWAARSSNLSIWSASCSKQGVQFRSLTDSIDTGTPSGRFFFHVMASLAEMERELTVERTRAGLAVAEQLGRKGGRKPKMTDSKIESAKKTVG